MSAFFLENHQGLLDVQDDFASLDDPVEQEAFTDYQTQGDFAVAVSQMVVQGMYCAACADAVQVALEKVTGVKKVILNAATRKVQVHWDPQLTKASLWAHAAGKKGYRLLPFHQAQSWSERLIQSRKTTWRLFVAGFCMMQVMMYSWPLYWSAHEAISADAAYLLRWASWLLTLPVLLFSAQPFFSRAWQDIRSYKIGMDVPVALGIALAFGVSSFATFDPQGIFGNEIWFDSVVMLVFFLLGGRYLESRIREKTMGALDGLMNRLPDVCERKNAQGGWESVSVRRLNVGDQVRIAPGKAFPADAMVLAGRAIVDESLLTGESKPVVHECGDHVIAGSLNLSEWVTIQIEKMGIDTRYAQIVRLMEEAALQKPKIAYWVDKLAGPFLLTIVLLAIMSIFLWWPQGPSQAIQVAVAVLIVTCPCALSLATPAALLASSGVMMKKGLLIRHMQAFETLSQIQQVVFDKTGTLTQEPMTLRRVRVLQTGALTTQVWQGLAQAASCSSHPVAKAIVAHAQSQEGIVMPMPFVDMKVHEEPAKGLSWTDSHSAEHWRIGQKNWVLEEKDEQLKASELLAFEPEGPVTWITKDGCLLAVLEWEETLLPQAAALIEQLQSQGLGVHLLSGDHPASVARVAHKLGIAHYRAMATPQDKRAYVQSLQPQKVWFIGDGVNDAPVMAQADVSTSMAKGAALLQAKSDFIIQGQHISQLFSLYRQSIQTIKIIRQNLGWAIAYNTIAIPLAISGELTPWLAGLGMAISSLLVVANALRLLERRVT